MPGTAGQGVFGEVSGGGGGGGSSTLEGFVFLRPIDGVVNDAPHVNTVETANAYKKIIIALPGLAGQKFQILSDQPTVSGTTMWGTPGTIFQQPTPGSTLTGATFQGMAALGAAFLLNGGSPSPVVGASQMTLTTDPGVGTLLRITVDALTAGSIFLVTASVPAGPNFLVTLDREMNYALLNTNPAGQSIQAVTARPQDIRVFGNGMRITGPQGSGFVVFDGAYRCHFEDVVCDASDGAGGTMSAFSLGIGSVESGMERCYVSAPVGHGYLHAGCERCYLTHCFADQISVTGMVAGDVVACYYTDLASNAATNAFVFTSGTGRGSFRSTLVSGKFFGGVIGVKVEGACFDLSIGDVVASGNSNAGMLIDASGNHDITISNFVARGNAVAGLLVADARRISLSGCAIDCSGTGGANGVGIQMTGTAELDATGVEIVNGDVSGCINLTGTTSQLRLSCASLQAAGALPVGIFVAGSATAFLDKVHVQLDTQGYCLLLQGTADVECSYWTFGGAAIGISYAFAIQAAGVKLRIGPGNRIDQAGRPLAMTAGNYVALQNQGGMTQLPDGNPTLTWQQTASAVIQMTPTANRTVSLPVDLGLAQAIPGTLLLVENNATLIAGFSLTVQVTGGTGFAVAATKSAWGKVDKTGLAFVRVSPDT
jgi:hypothetical protein